jgi:GYF domain 2
MLWFVNQDGKTEGPLPEERVAQLLRWGKISRSAYVCDEQLSNWVSIQRTAFAPLLRPAPPHPPAEVDNVRLLGALRGGPWRLSTRAALRLGGVLTAMSVLAGALQLASGLVMSYRSANCSHTATTITLSPLHDTAVR